ncbi:UNVERIFIED_CONTAM: hypothetical protein Slati_1718300 [Sesamum latifolium]|uniref:Uncharacterized protein n=1 Tax=Sesamum latifolium TaxID=2727402 RepID=A0AAW2WY92_9LAMI
MIWAPMMVYDAVVLGFFCGDARYKPTRKRNSRRKKSLYVILRYLSLIPRLQRLYALVATAEHMTWHATYQMEEGSICHPFDAEAWRFRTMVIPDLSIPKHLIDIYLEPLIEELMQLWHTVNDQLANGMAFGRSTEGVMGCPIYMDDTWAFHLQHDKKAYYFDCHKQFLLQDHPYRRNKKAFTKNMMERNGAWLRLTGAHIQDRLQS